MAKVLNIKQFVFDYGITQAELSEVLGLKQPQVSLLLNGKRKVQEKHEEAMRKKYGNLIDTYFVDNIAIHPQGVTIFPSAVVDEIREEVRQELAEEVEIKETVIITPEIVNKEGIDIKKELKAGTLDAEVKPTQDVLPPHHAKVYTENDEMSPEVDANDPVFVRLLSSKHDFLNGRMYFVNLENGSVIRWVVRLDADNVRLISMKDEETVPMSAIKSISEVVAITKRPKTLPKERVTFDEAIARKDNQLDALLDQQSRLIDQQGRMIDLLEKKTN